MPDLWPQYHRLKKTLREKSVYLWIFVHLQKLKNPIRVGWIHLGHKIERDRQEHTSDTVVEWEVERKIPTPLRVCSIAFCTFRNKNPCRELFHLATHLESVGLETTHSRSETLPAVLTAKYWLCATASSKAVGNHLWTGWVMLLMYCTLLYQKQPTTRGVFTRPSQPLSFGCRHTATFEKWMNWWHLKSKAMAIIDIAVGVYEATLAGGF